MHASEKVFPPDVPVSGPSRPSTNPPSMHRTPYPAFDPVSTSSSKFGVAPLASVPRSSPEFLVARMPSPPLPVIVQAATSACALRSRKMPWLALFWMVFVKICDVEPL